MVDPPKCRDTFDEQEVERRAEALARAVLSMPPERQKDVPRTRPMSKRKAREGR